VLYGLAAISENAFGLSFRSPPCVAGRQDYEVRYEAKKTGRSKAAVKKAVKRSGRRDVHIVGSRCHH
jgi:hypothetical protein